MPVTIRKIAANRTNAKFSTGPKSAFGRRRSSRNARQHGLNLPILADRNLSGEVRRLAARIAGSANDPTVQRASQRVALALIELERIESIAHGIIARCCDEENYLDSSKGAFDLENLSISLERLDRYKKRALAKRRKAIKRLGLARQGLAYDLQQTDKTKPKKPVGSTFSETSPHGRA